MCSLYKVQQLLTKDCPFPRNVPWLEMRDNAFLLTLLIYLLHYALVQVRYNRLVVTLVIELDLGGVFSPASGMHEVRNNFIRAPGLSKHYFPYQSDLIHELFNQIIVNHGSQLGSEVWRSAEDQISLAQVESQRFVLV